ncbi:MAG: hypothetical protein JWN52_2964 [Actinomycetia bacterium]|nr:hypothetical protein [Actinomycetes bacterium]
MPAFLSSLIVPALSQPTELPDLDCCSTGCRACCTIWCGSPTRVAGGVSVTCRCRCWEPGRCRGASGIAGFTAIIPQVWATFGVRRDPLTRRFEPPDEATIRRVVEDVHADALDAAIGS